MNPTVHLDFETYSEAPLRVCGGYRYAMDRTTEILCACYSFDDEDEVFTWVPCITQAQAKQHGLPVNSFWKYGPEVPSRLASAVATGATIIAHNASFERAIWEAVVVRRHGGPKTKREQFVCTAARSAASGLPRSLEHVAMSLGEGNQKDTEGSKLLKIFAMPKKVTKKDTRARIFPLDMPDEFKRLCSYCQQDVRTEKNVDKKVPHLHPREQALFAFDMLVNERGLRIDIPMVEKASRIVAQIESEIVAEVVKLTTCDEWPEGLRPTQRDKMLKFFDSIGVILENMQADHVRKYMRENIGKISELGRRLLLLRMEASKASTKKFVSMMAYCGPDQLARGTLLFTGAHTGRWSGKGIQPHNFIRGKLKYEEQLRVFELIKMNDHELFDLFYEWPLTAISSCMRGFIIPSEGKILRVVDYASIEARVLAWLAQEEWVLKVYESGLNLYKQMAAAVFNIEDAESISKDCNEYKIGKNLVLGCGYGLGAAKFVAYSEKAGVEISEAFAKQAVKAYRTKHRKIVSFWYDVERCAIAAVRNGATRENPVTLRNLQFFVEDQWFCIKLPVGRCLRYFRPKVVPVEKFGEPALQLQFKTEFRGRLVTESTYGGKLVENIVQATARDILVEGMYQAEQHGYRVIGTVHDEILTEQLPDEGSIHELEKIVCQLPSWANGLPISAEGFESYRYRK